MTNEYTDQDISLQDVLERVFSKLELPYDAERVAASIMAGVRNEIRAIVNEPTVAPEPPTLAVGTRVRVTDGYFVGDEGIITSLHEKNSTKRLVKIDDYDGSYPFSIDDLEPITIPADILAQLDHADSEVYDEIKRFFGLTEEKITQLRKPTFTAGQRVRTLAMCGDLPSGLLGTIKGQRIDNPDHFDVIIDADGHSYLFETRELEPAQPAPTLPQEVLDLSPAEYEAYSMSKNIAIHEQQRGAKEGFTPPYIIDSLLDKGLIEAFGTGRETTYRAVVAQPAPVAALPEGVTRDADSDRITYSVTVDSYNDFTLRWNFETKLVSIMPRSDTVIAELDELKNIVAAAQALIAEVEANNGR